MCIYRLRNSIRSVVACVAVAAAIPTVGFAQDWGGIREKVKDSLVFIETVRQARDGTNREVLTSTGFIVSRFGHVLTVAHAVPRPSDHALVEYRASVRTRYGQKYKVHVITRDDDLDLALLMLPNAQAWQPVGIIDRSASVPEDARLYVLGFPLASDLSSAEGLLSSHFGEGGRWQTTLPLNFGNSGGPVFDVGGRVVGIAAGGFDQAQAVTYVIPADYSRAIRSLVTAVPNTYQIPRPSDPSLPMGLAQTFPFAITVGHEEKKPVQQEYCVQKGFAISSINPTVTSQSGYGTEFKSAVRVPGKPNCVALNMFVAGDGVERLGGIIVNYRGRGALSGKIEVVAYPQPNR